MVTESRQAQIVSDDIRRVRCGLIGLGTAGSWAAVLLVKLGIRELEMWDNDTVDPPNLTCQVYGEENLGQTKPDALRRVLDLIHVGIGLTSLSLHSGEFRRPKGEPPDVVISCVDSWKGRRAALEWARRGSKLFVEARMASRLSCIHAFDPAHDEDVTWWEGTLGSDDEPEIPCGMRGTAFLGAQVGATIAGLVTCLANGEPIPRESIYHLGLMRTVNFD